MTQNIVVAFFRGDELIAERLRSGPQYWISTPALAELHYGARASTRPEENLRRLEAFTRLVPAVSFDPACAEIYGKVRAALRRLGRPTGETDMQIAAVALAHDAVLVTHNRKHFEAIEGLLMEDWIT